MSRSIRKPYGYPVRVRGTQADRTMAAKNYRRITKQAISNCQNFEEFLDPHFRECYKNDPWTWDGDGPKRRQVPTHWQWSRYCMVVQGIADRWNHEYTWPPAWYVKSLRK